MLRRGRGGGSVVSVIMMLILPTIVVDVSPNVVAIIAN